mmetsp:Transcript_26852/g.78547  ORF Transcript_26852/g.78547 Transcript_26852/m.78547 type:complete len:219 (-) Transcript_26852:83-739(-)
MLPFIGFANCVRARVGAELVFREHHWQSFVHKLELVLPGCGQHFHVQIVKAGGENDLSIGIEAPLLLDLLAVDMLLGILRQILLAVALDRHEPPLVVRGTQEVICRIRLASPFQKVRHESWPGVPGCRNESARESVFGNFLAEQRPSKRVHDGRRPVTVRVVASGRRGEGGNPSNPICKRPDVASGRRFAVGADLVVVFHPIVDFALQDVHDVGELGQ